MQHRRLYLAILAILLLVSGLVYSAIESTAREVTTVDQLNSSKKARYSLRLAGRVTDDQVVYRTSPSFFLSFRIRDIKSPNTSIPVEYSGIMPDTFQAGRDVILEGDFNGAVFQAKSMLTQCPSKYEVPLPGGGKYYGDTHSTMKVQPNANY